MENAVLATMFNVVFKGNGFDRSLIVARFEMRIADKTKIEITAIITFVGINSEPESVAVCSNVKSFKTIEFVPDITKNARHTGRVALENFCFVPTYGITVAMIIKTTEIIIVMVGLSPR